MNIDRILCPIDFSEASRHALDQAVVLAGYYHAQITALHVFTPFARVITAAVAGEAELNALDRLRRKAADESAAAVARQIGVDVVVDEGQAAAVILDRAKDLVADLVVMGTHGATGFEHMLLGSVTERVLRKASCPVLTVPPRSHGISQLPFKRLLCAVDFSSASMQAIRWASSLSEESGAELTLLHVLEWPWDEPPPPSIDELPAHQARALTEFRRYLQTSAAARLESLVPEHLGRSRTTTKVANGKAYVQILATAAEQQSDLIVIGIHGRSRVDLALFGSTAHQIVCGAACSVLTLRD
jgi:nucleotide-binding universal stress UspA family protein